MAKDPAFLFYPGDWLGGTMTFSRSHKGAYMDILMAQFNSGHLSGDDIRFVLGQDYDSMWESKLKAKFEVDAEGKFFNEKLEYEMNRRRKFVSSRVDNLDPDKKTKHHMGNHMEHHTEGRMESGNGNRNRNTNTTRTVHEKHEKTNSPINIPFSDVWNAYDHKVGSKHKAELKWCRLKAKEREAIMVHVPVFIQATLGDRKQYRPHLTTYLNGRLWESESLPVNGVVQGASQNPYADQIAEALRNYPKQKDNDQ